jgi:hypothetical protein
VLRDPDVGFERQHSAHMSQSEVRDLCSLASGRPLLDDWTALVIGKPAVTEIAPGNVGGTRGVGVARPG